MPYSEGALGADVAAKVERHVASCPRCAAELEMIRSVTRALGNADVCAKEPASDLWARVSARIENECVRPAHSPKLGVAAGAAAAVLVGLIGMKLLMPGVAPVVAPEPAGVKKIARNAPLLAPKPKLSVKHTSQRTPLRPTSKPVEMASLPVRDRAPLGKLHDHLSADSDVDASAVRLTAPGAEAALHSTERKAYPVAAPLAPTPTADGCRVGEDAAAVPAGSASNTPAAEGVNGEAPATTDGVAVARASIPASTPTAGGVAMYRAGDSAAVNAGLYCNDTTKAALTVSIVEELNETEGIRTAAVFSY